jgi:glycosyltransferase involved in cell wall biosynthesis
MTVTTPAGFSIIICTHNGKGRLEPTLAHIARLVIPADYSVELIVVDNASTDSTSGFVKATWERLGSPFSLRLLQESRPGKGHAVETGYDAARYSLIVTVDDDNWLDKGYLVHAKELFELNAAIGILQGHSTGVFETEPPSWLAGFKELFIIGSPVKEPGYFPETNFFVWGAGMVIKNSDWRYVRSLGFSALTSKMPGKAAGEDNELAIVLMLLGRRAYYSDGLKYKHFMPSGRVTWQKLWQNFETHGYVHHYFFLYTLVIDAYKQGYTITPAMIRKRFASFALGFFKKSTFKQHLAYWILPRQEYYQLQLHLYYSQVKWFLRLRKNALKDIHFIQSWMLPLLEKRSGDAPWPLLDRML